MPSGDHPDAPRQADDGGAPGIDLGLGVADALDEPDPGASLGAALGEVLGDEDGPADPHLGDPSPDELGSTLGASVDEGRDGAGLIGLGVDVASGLERAPEARLAADPPDAADDAPDPGDGGFAGGDGLDGDLAEVARALAADISSSLGTPAGHDLGGQAGELVATTMEPDADEALGDALQAGLAPLEELAEEIDGDVPDLHGGDHHDDGPLDGW